MIPYYPQTLPSVAERYERVTGGRSASPRSPQREKQRQGMQSSQAVSHNPPRTPALSSTPSLPHGVTQMPCELQRLLDDLERPVSIPGGDIAMEASLETHLHFVRKKTVLQNGLQKVRRKLCDSREASLEQTSPTRQRSTHNKEAEYLIAPASVPYEECFETRCAVTEIPSGSTDMPGHLLSPLSDATTARTVSTSPQRSLPLKKHDTVERNPRYWKYGSQDGNGLGRVTAADGGWIWVEWQASKMQSCYEWSGGRCGVMLSSKTIEKTATSSVHGGQMQRDVQNIVNSIHTSPSPQRKVRHEAASPTKLRMGCSCHAVVGMGTDTIKWEPPTLTEEDAVKESVMNQVARQVTAAQIESL